jgi:hypothetical protein
MSERPEPDLDRVRRALRDHDARREDEPEPKQDDEPDAPENGDADRDESD